MAKIYINGKDPLLREVEIAEVFADGSAKTTDGNIISSLSFSEYYEPIDPDSFLNAKGGFILQEKNNNAQQPTVEAFDTTEYPVTDSVSNMKPPERLSPDVLANIRFDEEFDGDEVIIPSTNKNINHPLAHLLPKTEQNIVQQSVIKEDPIVNIFTKVKKNNKETITISIDIDTPSHDQIKILNDMFEGMSLIEYLAQQAINNLLKNSQQLIDQVIQDLEVKVFNIKPKVKTEKPVKVTKPRAKRTVKPVVKKKIKKDDSDIDSETK